MGSEQWKVRTIQVARNQQSSSQPQSLMGCSDPQSWTHIHTFRSKIYKYMFAVPRLDRLALVPWVEMCRFKLLLHLSIFFSAPLHLHHRLVCSPASRSFVRLAWGVRRLWWGGNEGCIEAYSRSREAEPDYSDHSVAAENQELALPHHLSDFTLMANSFLTRTGEAFNTFAVQ